ncbi:MAG: nucleotidyltransferase family protein [Deltaproteobacteria bacterium]|nr:nucleotidyltransferase family protein [Deltaproteobacteria bacterium]
MEAIVLAGGFGTRLSSVVKDVPKPMAEVAGAPFLAYLMDYLNTQKVGKAVLSVGYKHEVIEDYFGRRFKGVAIEYAVEDTALGTGGAIRRALEKISDETPVILNGDTLFRVDLSGALDCHRLSGAVLTMALKRVAENDRYGSVMLDGNRITGFREKTGEKEDSFINGGVYVINREIFGLFKESREKFSFELDFLQKNIPLMNAVAYISNKYFIDIGIPRDYAKARKELFRMSKRIGL